MAFLCAVPAAVFTLSRMKTVPVWSTPGSFPCPHRLCHVPGRSALPGRPRCSRSSPLCSIRPLPERRCRRCGSSDPEWGILHADQVRVEVGDRTVTGHLYIGSVTVRPAVGVAEYLAVNWATDMFSKTFFVSVRVKLGICSGPGYRSPLPEGYRRSWSRRPSFRSPHC